MNIPEVVRLLDAEIGRLQQARQLLGTSGPALSEAVVDAVEDVTAEKRRGRPPGANKPAPKLQRSGR